MSPLLDSHAPNSATLNLTVYFLWNGDATGSTASIQKYLSVFGWFAF
jgi:hypothetical protein